MVIAPQFRWAGPFSDGLAVLCTTPPFNWTDGSPVADEDTTSKCGYIDKQGKLVIGAQFDGAEPFREGLAAVRAGDANGDKWGCIAR